MAEELEIEAPPITGSDDDGKLPPFLRKGTNTPQTSGGLPPFLRGNQPPSPPVKSISDVKQSQTTPVPPSGDQLIHATGLPPQGQVQDVTRTSQQPHQLLPAVTSDLDDSHAKNLTDAKQRYASTILSQSPGIAKTLSYNDMLHDIRNNVLGAQDSGKTPEQVDQDRMAILKKYIGDSNTPSNEQLMLTQVGKDPFVTARVINEIKKQNPELGKQLDADAMLINGEQRPQNMVQQMQNLQGIKNGDLTYNHLTGQVEKPLGFWGSLGYGARSSANESKQYDQFSSGSSQDNIDALEKMMAVHNPDVPKEMPVGFGRTGAMLGANGLPMITSAAADLAASAVGQPELMPAINSAIFGRDAYRKSWVSSYTNTYARLRQQGMTPVNAEQEARTQAEYDSKVDAATAVVATLAMSRSGLPELGKAENEFGGIADNLGNELRGGDELGQAIHTEPPELEPEYQQAINKLSANTVGDKTSSLTQDVALKGGAVSTLNTIGNSIKNIHDGRPVDENNPDSFWGSMIFNAGLAVLARSGEGVAGLAKENVIPEMHPDTEEGAKLFFEEPDKVPEPVAAPGQGPLSKRVSDLEIKMNTLLDQAKGEIGKGNIQGISKNVLEEAAKDPEQLKQALGEAAEQANDPNSANIAEAVYGKPLVDIAKQVNDLKAEQASLPTEDTGETTGLTGIKNAASRALRGDMNLPPVELPKIGTDTEILQNGKNLVDSGKIDPSDIVSRILADPEVAKKGMDSDESAAMQYHMHQLAKAENDTRAAYNTTDDPEQKAVLGQNLQQIKDRADAATQANMLAGTDWSKVGRTRQVMADAGFNPYREKASIKEAYGGDIPEEVQKNIDTILKERDDALAEVDRLNKQLSDQKADPNSDEKVQKMTTAYMIAAQTKVNAANSKLQQARIKALNSQQSQLQRGMAFVNRWERRTVLSGLPVLEKLSGAATIGSAAQQVPEMMVGQFWSNIFEGIAKKAPIEGFPNAESLGKYYSEMTDVDKFIKNTADIYKTGETDLSREFGSPHEHYAWYDALLDTHQVIKDPVKRAKFQSSLSQFSSWAENQKDIDTTDPLVMEYMRQQAYKRAEYEIFQEDNKLSTWFNNQTNKLSKGDKFDQVTGALMKFMLPVNKVPINMARRMGISVIGVPKGLIDIGLAYKNGIENLKPEQADMIMRELTKGSTGLAYWLAGAYMYKEIGGLYTKYDREAKNAGPTVGEMKLGGIDIPKPLQHALPFQLMNSGATAMHIWDRFQDKNDNIASSFINAAKGTVGATVGEVPIIQEPVNAVQGLTDPYMGDKFNQEMVGRFVPRLVKDAGVVSPNWPFPEKVPAAEKSQNPVISGHR